jgi:hypothetical protein
MGEKPTEASEQALLPAATSASAGETSTAVAPAEPSEPVEKDSPLAEIDVSVDPATGKTSVKFAYVCLHCGAPREVDSGRYVADCPACGQTAQRGNEQLDAVARGEHVPTFDRSSSFYP